MDTFPIYFGLEYYLNSGTHPMKVDFAKLVASLVLMLLIWQFKEYMLIILASL